MTRGVAITCTVTGDQYLGGSGQIEMRVKQHRHDLIDGHHINRCLQAAWKQHGASAFTFRTLELIPEGASEQESRQLLNAAELRHMRELLPAYNHIPAEPLADDVGVDLWGTSLIKKENERRQAS